MFTLTRLTVSDMVAASAALRHATNGATTMEDAANAITTYTRDTFRDTDGTPAFGLIRLFQTIHWERLTPQLRSYAQARMPDQQPPHGIRCLTLFATAGDHPAWQDRRASRNHQAIPLTSPEILNRAPFVLTALDHLLTHHTPDQPDTPLDDILHITDAPGSPHLPGQDFIQRHTIRSALALSGTLADGDTYTLVLYSHPRINPETAELFRAYATAIRHNLLPHTHSTLFTTQRPTPTTHDTPEHTDFQPLTPYHPTHHTADTTDQRHRRLEQESRIVETLYSVGQSLARELDLRKLVHTAIEAATSVVNAQLGAFFYTLTGTDTQPQTRFALAGVPAETFERFPLPRRTALFGAEPPSSDALRLHDVTADPRYGQLAPFNGMPPGHPPVRAYLAVPVRTAAGEIIGTFYFGHANPGVFTERDEELAKGIAAQAAAAIDNARLYRQERDTAVELQRSLLPAAPPAIAELDIAFKYLPGAQGTQVGGDWFDVIPLAAGRVALVIGDVMGRGIRAAAIMGQLRTAVRAYAVMDLAPALVMHQLNRLVCGMGTDTDVQISTCVYAVYDPGDATICWANAGHLPPALRAPDGTVSLLEIDLGMPLGIDEAVFDEQQRPMPAGSSLLLYTDGLVECHGIALSDRLQQLRDELARAGTDVTTTCERLTSSMLTGEEHDDTALLLVRAQHAEVRKAALDLPPTGESAGAARRFVRHTLADWQMDGLTDTITSVVSEMVTNAYEHAGTALRLRLRHHPGRMIVEVADHDGRIPRPAVVQLLDEHHRGLLIVGSLARRWGVRPTETGKIIWAEIDDPLPGPPQPSASRPPAAERLTVPPLSDTVAHG